MNKIRLIILALILSGILLLSPAQANPLPEPIVILYNSNYASNPFGLYLGEILRAEGLNAYATFNIYNKTGSQVAAELAQRELAILAETTLTTEQATAISNYVAGGGRLIAMRPDAQIKGLFGLGSASGSLANGYVKILNSANWNGKTPGIGLASQPLQIHGTADQYTSGAGAVVLAELYSGAGTPTGYPAVVGSASGKTAAFTYDLARNVIYTRQGNPANANVDADGDGVVRTVDLFMGTGGGAPWVDRDLIPVPQADEQQRLFARLVKQVLADIKPFPQLWYFADAAKTALILTGDAHANPSSYFQSEINSLNAHNGKITFYISIAAEPNDTEVQTWRSQGHEFGIHPYQSLTDTYVCSSFSECYPLFKNWFESQFSSAPSRTVRNHMVAWEGWTTAAEIAEANSFNMDMNFYHWGTWLQKPDGTWPHGYITGSGQPMKFIRQDGTIINNYQLLTELVDEQLIVGAGMAPEQLNTELATIVSKQLIDDSQRFSYAALVAQFHIDYYGSAQLWAENTLDFASTRGVRISNADAFLTFTEARNAAKFNDIAWNAVNNTLTFNLTAPSTAGGDYTIALPFNHNNLSLATVSVDGTPKVFSIQEIKQERLAFIRVTPGNHTFQAVYQSGLNILTHTSYADFTPACASVNGISASEEGGGSLVLAGELYDYFNGTSLDVMRWSWGPWEPNPSYTPVVNNGVLTMPGGGWVRSIGTYTRATIEATAQFGNGPWQHIGFGDTSLGKYIIFSTYNGTTNLYARVNNLYGEQLIDLGAIPTGFHKYKLVWEAANPQNDRATFYIDGILKTQLTFNKSGVENLFLYLSNNGSANLVIEDVQAYPRYTASGTYTSCALDAGLNKEWKAVSWDAFAGSSNLLLEARTSANGSTWTGWSTITNNGGSPAVPNRYIQYRLTLSTDFPANTPVVNSISLLSGLSGPIADLSVTKTDGQTSVVAGDGVQYTYTITVSNAGPSSATNVSLSDTWPSAFTRGTVTPSQGSCSGSPSFTCSLGTLAPGGSATVTARYTVPASAPAGTVINTATVSASENDPNNTNDTASDTTTVTRIADLSVSKTDGQTSVVAGDGVQYTYTIVVSNAGPSSATNVSLGDAWPSAFTRGTVTPSQGSCSGSPSFTCSLGTLAPGGSATVTARYTVPASAPSGTVINTATVSASENDPNNTNDTASDTTTVTRIADLSVSKTDGQTSVVAGDGVQYTYTIVVSNAGPSSATNVSLGDAWPSAFTRGTVTPSQGSCSGSPSFTCSLGTLMPGGSATVTARYTVPASAPAGTVTNTVAVSASENDPNNTNDTASDTTTVTRIADLSVSKTDGQTSVVAGDGVQYTYTITVSNAGPSSATNVSLSDSWPSAFTRGTVTPSQGTCSGSPSFTCNLGTLSPGGSATVTARYTVPASAPAGTVTNTAVVSASENDPNSDNNTASDTTTVTRIADLSVSKTDGQTSVAAGTGVYTYTIVVRNDGPSVASGIILTDTWPTVFTRGTVTPSQGSCSDSDPFTCSLGTLAPGGSATVTARYTVSASAPAGTATNSVVVSAAETDSNLANNTADDDTSITLSADLSLAMEASKASSFVGDQITFTITVANAGPSLATGVKVKNFLPAGYQYLDSTASKGTYTSLDGLWDIGEINPGETETLTISVKVNYAPGQYQNRAEIWESLTPDPDSTPGNSSTTEDDEDVAEIRMHFLLLPIISRAP